MSIIYTRKKGKRPAHKRQSSRGTELMNYMELYGSPQMLAASGLSPWENLQRLANRYSNNRFYQRLENQKNQLSYKQIHMINLDYNLKYLNH
jgi:hypothetical protein